MLATLLLLTGLLVTLLEPPFTVGLELELEAFAIVWGLEFVAGLDAGLAVVLAAGARCGALRVVVGLAPPLPAAAPRIRCASAMSGKVSIANIPSIIIPVFILYVFISFY